MKGLQIKKTYGNDTLFHLVKIINQQMQGYFYYMYIGVQREISERYSDRTYNFEAMVFTR